MEQTPFGVTSYERGTTTENLRFPGQYWDEEKQSSYNYYRDSYTPRLGRYGQPEPIGQKGVIALKKTWANIFKWALIIIIVTVVLKLVYSLVLIDIMSGNIKLGLSNLYSLSEKLCEYHEMNGEYPATNIFPSEETKIFNSFTYVNKNNDWFEIRATVNNFIKRDSLFMTNPEGIYIISNNGEKRLWFDYKDICKYRK